jgi:ATP-binding cassette subfamily B protein
MPVHRATGHISFRDVSFEYPASGRVLHGVSFTAAPGTRVGIVGASGSGKSTLVNLLTRFYDPSCGQILLDGRDLRSYSLASLRRQFSIILQEPVLFSATVAENIAYARPDASRQEIMDAAKLAQAHDFIVALPQGYDTKIGQGGSRLSGGQGQRITIARAFLKDAPILILDEATSAVDFLTEGEIMLATEELIRGRTLFMIAHRLNTLKSCDLLLVLKQGSLRTITTDFEVVLQELSPEPGAKRLQIGNLKLEIGKPLGSLG